MKTILIKFVVLSLLVGGALYATDKEGIFDPDDTNDHVAKKWNHFYDLTQKIDIDILLLGSSHLYTGLNPKNLSCALGANAFIIAAPGTKIADTYYGLLEALELCQPKVVVIETYGIKEAEVQDMTGGNLSDQFKSFSARRNIAIKLQSTPSLFSVQNAPYAWSNTLRNHRFLFNDYAQIERNLKKRKTNVLERQKDKDDGKLYLGRYVRFLTGIKDSVLNLYDSLGAPVDGEEFTLNEEPIDYLRKIEAVCEEEGIELVYLTIPMYHKHIADYPAWKATLGAAINPMNEHTHWLDLQDPYDEDLYDKHSFEDTYAANQHMTYQGSIITAYKLANYIHDSLNIEMPDRSSDPEWRELFYGEEGFFENQPPNPDDEKNRILLQNQDLNNGWKLLELDLVKSNKQLAMIAKIDRSTVKEAVLNKYFLRVVLVGKLEGMETPQRFYVDIPYDRFRSPLRHHDFVQSVKQMEIFQILSIQVLVKGQAPAKPGA